MQFFSLWLSWKFLRFGKKDKNISFMIKICFLSIFIGTAALMLTLTIMAGFEKTIHKKLMGITSEAIIHSPGKRLDGKSIKEFLKRNFRNEIKAASGSILKQIIIDHNKNQSILFLKGVDKDEELVSTIGKKMVLPIGKRFGKILEPAKDTPEKPSNNIIIGYKTAKQYKFSIGQKVSILIPEPGSRKKIFLKKREVTIAGIFNVGFDEYDSNFAYCSLDFMQSLYKKEKGVDRISLAFKKPPHKNIFVKISDYFKKKPPYKKEILTNLKMQLTGLEVTSWKKLYPSLVSALKLEKYLMFFILALITLVACMNMISLLFMQIQQKRRDIAIFRAMGMAQKNIKRLFLSIGLSITFFAAITGLIVAGIIAYFLKQYPFIELPDVYFVTTLPVHIDIELFVIVFVSTMLLGFIATLIAARSTKKIKIVDVLKAE